MLRTGQAALGAALVLSVSLYGSGPVLADVTADEVWLSWQDLAQSQGQKLTADSVETDGDTLMLTGVTLTLDGEFGSGNATLPDIDLIDNGDGTVSVVMADSFPITMILPGNAAGAPSTTLDMTITAPGADIIASGVPTAINYEQSLPRLDLTAKGVTGADQSGLTLKMTDVAAKYLSEAGESGQNLSGGFSSTMLDLTATGTGSGGDAQIKLSLNNLDGQVDLTGLSADTGEALDVSLDRGLTFDASLTYGIGALDISGMDAGKPLKLAGTIGGGNVILGFDAGKFHAEALNKALALNVAGDDKGAAFTFIGSMADFSTSLDIKGQGWSKTGDFNAALKSGLIMAGTGAVGNTNIDFAGGPADKPLKFKAAMAGVQSSFALSAGQISSDLDAKAMTATLESADIPVPKLSIDLGQLAFALVMPAAKSDIPAPFSYLTRIVDLKLPEELWAIFDPSASLSHEPASLIIDTKGSVTLTKDLMEDATALQSGIDEAPGLLNALDIPQLLVRAGGAEVTAKGGFTFDNSDTTTFNGMPMPTGKIDIRATGLNTLIDKLVAMGIVPEDQAMQGRMMVSMFANTSATADEITSTLEFKDKGFFANGQQLQ